MAEEIMSIDKLSKKLMTEDFDLVELMKNGNCYTIKSDTGTGKSYLARKVMKALNNKYDLHFLSIVSRIGLAEEQYNDMKKEHILVQYYKDLFFKEGMSAVTTIDSIGKFKRVVDWSKYIIFVDEINSLLGYMTLCPNIKNRPDIIDLLIHILTNCRAFILTDADVSDTVFDFLDFIKRDNKHFIQNTFIHNDKIEAIEIGDMETMREMIKAETTKYLVCCDSASKAQGLHKWLDDPDSQIYTADDDIVGDFGSIPKLIISPKVVYGQDSSIGRNVYCIYDCGSIGSAEMKQQICRERKINKVYIYFTSLASSSNNALYNTYDDTVDATIKNNEFVENILVQKPTKMYCL